MSVSVKLSELDALILSWYSYWLMGESELTQARRVQRRLLKMGLLSFADGQYQITDEGLVAIRSHGTSQTLPTGDAGAQKKIVPKPGRKQSFPDAQKATREKYSEVFKRLADEGD